MGSTNMRRELAGIALTVFAIFLAGALFLQRETAGHASCFDATGVFGPVGTWMRCALLVSVGMPAAVLIALLPLVHALRLFGRMESATDRSWLVFLSGVAALLPVVLLAGLAFAAPAMADETKAAVIIFAVSPKSSRLLAQL